MTIYVNGEEAQLFDDTRDLNNGLGNNGQDDVYGVGRTYGNGEGQWVAGRMDDIRVYDHVLSAEEVAQLLTPDAGVPGDCDGDGQLTAADIDLLSAAAIAMTNDKAFDLNRDDIVDGKDRLVWVNDLRQTYFGDANLDGVFNTTDLIEVFQAGKFETGNSASWSEGDWSGDGLFGTSDLILAFQDGGFEQGPKAAQAVPEPASAFLAIIGALAIGVVCRRSDR